MKKYWETIDYQAPVIRNPLLYMSLCLIFRNNLLEVICRLSFIPVAKVRWSCLCSYLRRMLLGSPGAIGPESIPH